MDTSDKQQAELIQELENQVKLIFDHVSNIQEDILTIKEDIKQLKLHNQRIKARPMFGTLL